MAMGLPNDKSYSYAHATGAGTTTIKSSATGNIGILHSIVINQVGTTPNITINDGSNVVGVLIPTAVGTVFYDITFTGGLNIVTTTTGGDITIVFQ